MSESIICVPNPNQTVVHVDFKFLVFVRPLVFHRPTTAVCSEHRGGARRGTLQGRWLLGYSLMAFDAINYLIGVEEDRIINGAIKAGGIIQTQSLGGTGCEEKVAKISRSG